LFFLLAIHQLQVQGARHLWSAQPSRNTGYLGGCSRRHCCCFCQSWDVRLWVCVPV